MKINAFVLWLILAPVFCFSQNYSGTLGKYAIHLSLDNYKNSVEGFYFYDAHLQNISLEGTQTGHKLILHNKNSSSHTKEETFELVLKGNQLTGQWRHKQKSLKVNLTKTGADFQAFKRQHLKFKRDSVEKFGDREVVWYTEHYSKKPLFRLGNGFSKRQRRFVNPILDSIQKEDAELSLDCTYAEINYTIKLLSNKYLSFLGYYSTYCGGAHPNHGIKGFTYDLQRSQKIDSISQIFPHKDWYNLIKEKYRNDKNLQEECHYFSGEKVTAWEFADWVLTKNGLTVIPEFPYVLTPCEIEFHLSYGKLGGKP